MTSKNPTSRPRKVAGRPAGRTAGQAATTKSLETTHAEPEAEPEAVEVEVEAGPGLEPPPETDAGSPPATTDGAPPARRATLALVLAIVVLVAVAVLQAAYLWGPLEDDPTVSSGRPVLLSQAAERSAVETAATAATAFTQRSFSTYDDQVDQAAAMMTEDFAKEFRQTTDDAKQRFLDAEAEVTAEVAAQGVMTASDQQVEVLIFLNQFTTRTGEESVFTPFRLKVTLIDTDQGWLVSDVDAT